MNELQPLLDQKETLLEQLRQIAETCEGTENPSNAQKVSELNESLARLTAQKTNLENKIELLNLGITSAGEKIRRLSQSGVDKILAAIKNQRWYFFKNRPKIIFDRDTAYLWANLQYFPYGKNGNSEEYNAKEIRALLNTVNASGIDGYRDWKIPTPFELSRVVEDKTCPYREAALWKMIKAAFWCVNANGSYRGKVLEPTLVSHTVLDMNHGVYVYGNWNYNVFVLPCSAALVPPEYENNISALNTVYTEAEKLAMTLSIFVNNSLEPVFADETANEIYRQLFIVKPELQEKLSALQLKIDELSAIETLSPNLDWRALRLKFDADADSSPLRYAAAVKALTEFLLDKIEAPELRAELEEFRAEAVGLENKALSAKTLAEMLEIKSAPRPPCEFVVETLAGKIRATLSETEA
ncbi:MAG: hypothetical protein J5809_02445 [Selenomonadaceae bacterium]|nr:hypothetical protein [Selenomonadaceae bacterium]